MTDINMAAILAAWRSGLTCMQARSPAASSVVSNGWLPGFCQWPRRACWRAESVAELTPAFSSRSDVTFAAKAMPKHVPPMQHRVAMMFPHLDSRGSKIAVGMRQIRNGSQIGTMVG
ncbi:MAG TPA: hypothetical protein PK958_11455 [Rhodocyclaceae bacterium]|nr:hypothetical protein [Rhodocyclaceae bacterium]